MAPNVYNTEVTQHITEFTDTHPKNKIISLFEEFFIALDWSDEANNILVFETFKEYHPKATSMTSLPDNSNFILYSKSHHSMTYIMRDKVEQEQVIEDWMEVKL